LFVLREEPLASHSDSASSFLSEVSQWVQNYCYFIELECEGGEMSRHVAKYKLANQSSKLFLPLFYELNAHLTTGACLLCLLFNLSSPNLMLGRILRGRRRRIN
jgi:hypothetical protein